MAPKRSCKTCRCLSSRRVSDENTACSIYIRFFKITDQSDGRSFLMCSHDPFFWTNKNRIIKNGSCERAFKTWFHSKHSKTDGHIINTDEDVRNNEQLIISKPFCVLMNSAASHGNSTWCTLSFVLILLITGTGPIYFSISRLALHTYHSRVIFEQLWKISV